ncbi:hypothetical protein ACFL1H_08155 [Nanoarchaeota archaeon]
MEEKKQRSTLTYIGVTGATLLLTAGIVYRDNIMGVFLPTPKDPFEHSQSDPEPIKFNNAPYKDGTCLRTPENIYGNFKEIEKNSYGIIRWDNNQLLPVDPTTLSSNNLCIIDIHDDLKKDVANSLTKLNSLNDDSLVYGQKLSNVLESIDHSNNAYNRFEILGNKARKET